MRYSLQLNMTTFSHGNVKEDIYMIQPDRFKLGGKEYIVCKLKKSLIIWSNFWSSGIRSLIYD